MPAAWQIPRALRPNRARQFAARVDQHDLFETDLGASRNAAHFLDLTMIEMFEDGQIFAHDLRQPVLIHVESLGLRAIMTDRTRDLRSSLAAVLDATFIG